MKATAARLLAAKARKSVSCRMSNEWAGDIACERFVYECETQICKAVYKGENECAVEVFSLEKAKYAQRRFTANGYKADVFHNVKSQNSVYHLLTIKW